MEGQEKALQELITEDVETIAEHFSSLFAECLRNVRKPNILVAGITGAGKSSLVNSIFGAKLASVGDGLPVTQCYKRFAPPDKPVISKCCFASRTSRS